MENACASLSLSTGFHAPVVIVAAGDARKRCYVTVVLLCAALPENAAAVAKTVVSGTRILGR